MSRLRGERHRSIRFCRLERHWSVIPRRASILSSVLTKLNMRRRQLGRLVTMTCRTSIDTECGRVRHCRALRRGYTHFVWSHHFLWRTMPRLIGCSIFATWLPMVWKIRLDTNRLIRRVPMGISWQHQYHIMPEKIHISRRWICVGTMGWCSDIKEA